MSWFIKLCLFSRFWIYLSTVVLLNSRLPSWGFSLRLETNSDYAPNYDSNHNHAGRRGLTVTASTSDRIVLLACRKKKSSLKLPLSLKLCRLNKQFSQCTFGSANHPKDLKPKISGGGSQENFCGNRLARARNKKRQRKKQGKTRTHNHQAQL